MSAAFVKDKFDDLVENLVLYHHNPSKSINPELCVILQKADYHSSKECIGLDDESVMPLTSIFSRISFDDETGDDHYVPLVELDFNKPLHAQNKDVMSEWDLVQKYEDILIKFEKEFENLENNDLETVLAILKKYTSTIPASTHYSKSDISLYDHLKTTLAISNCRYLFSKEENLTKSDDEEVYRVINGELSGISDVLYDIQTCDNNMVKRLHGRSLYLNLLTEAVASRIIFDLNLDSSNIIYCSGGRFIIIAPNIKKTEEIINKISLFEEFGADLFLNIVSKPACGDELGEFDKVLSRLNLLSDENRKHKFTNQINELITKNNSNSLSEFDESKIGDVAANAKYLIKYICDEKITNSLFYSKLNIGYIFKKDKKGIDSIICENKDIQFTVYKLNDTDFLDIDIVSNNVSFDFKVMGNSVPNIDGKPLFLNHLAKLADGADKIGVVKIDADNLDLIFSKGLGEGAKSISRISSLSFYIDLYLSGRVNQVASRFNFATEQPKDIESEIIELEFNDLDKKTIFKPKGKLPKGEGVSSIYVIYSGEDDLLAVGPYDDVIKFALEFRNKFKKWATNNDLINLSAGIVIVKPEFSIGKAAIMADRELKISKSSGKNKITMFNEPLSWEEFEKIFDF